MKYIKLLLCLGLTFLLFCSCGKKNNSNIETTLTETTSAAETVPTETTIAMPETTAKPVATAAAANPVTEVVEETTSGAKYGDSELMLNTDNKFVDAVVEKYGIDRDGLVTAYSVKGGDNNYVWQFDGSRDTNGKYIRNSDTLKYVYSVTNDCSSVCRTGGYTDNDGCSKKDGLTVFMLTQKVLLPNLQDQINA